MGIAAAASVSPEMLCGSKSCFLGLWIQTSVFLDERVPRAGAEEQTCLFALLPGSG